MDRNNTPGSLDEINSFNEITTAGSECSFIYLSKKKSCLRQHIIEKKQEKEEKGKVFILFSYFSNLGYMTLHRYSGSIMLHKRTQSTLNLLP